MFKIIKNGLTQMSEELKCPSCGQPMKKGFIQAPEGLFWDKEKHNWEILSSEQLINHIALRIPNKEAFRCENCKLVVFRY
jgi:hypothetical protein